MRGYTFHEHLEMVGLINMNGRVYDPILGRMLSPDNLVPDAANTQGYNRYSYCYNNPLKYTDPDGNEPITLTILAVVALGTYLGGSSANNSYNPTKWNYSSGKTYAGMALGGGTALLATTGVGGVLAAGTISGGGNALIAGGNAGDIVSGSIFGMMGAGIGLGVGTSVASTAMMGKVSSKFWQAAISAGTGGFAGGFSMTTMSGLAAGRSLGESLQQGVTVGGITALGAGIFAGMSAKYAKPTKPLDNDGTILSKKVVTVMMQMEIY